nr:hypothetical protein [uncultured Mediterranean phage uvMED]
MRMALVAVESEKISDSEAARRFEVPRTTLIDRRKAGGSVDGSVKRATSEERQKWHQDKADGMSIRQIAKKHGRSRESVSNELKKDPPVIKPATKPEGMACEIVAREKKAIPKQLKAVEGLVSLECQLRRSWKADQKRWEKAGRSVWQHNVQEAHDVISSNGCLAKHREILGLSEQASYLEVLDVLEARAKSAMASIQWLKYLSGYTELPGAQP